MARSEATKDYNTFVRGIITEANALTYPENASLDEDNFVLLRDGSRQRRLGMDYESDYTLSSNTLLAEFNDNALSVHEWRNADNSGLYNFAVVQIGAILHFYDLSSAPLSGNKKAFTVNLIQYKTSSAISAGIERISGSVGKGVFFVVSENLEPFYITYDSSADTIAITTISLSRRDFKGVDDGLAVDNRPTTLSAEHNYNLLNQGWTGVNITAYFNSRGVYPSNSDIWLLGKNASDDFDPVLMDKQFFGNSPAPKGHYVLDVFSRDRSLVSGVSGIAIEVEKNRFNSVRFYAGRAFYAGVASDNTSDLTLNADIYFSKILVDLDDAGQCYQEADPTSEDLSVLLGDDGGIIVIPEIGRVLGLETVFDSLIVFADNGVWQIKGDLDGGFSATSSQVQKVSNLGALSAESIVVAEDKILYWASSGIYVLGAAEKGNSLSASNLTEVTIQTLYQDIPSISKKFAKGSYDVISKRISWLYNDSDSFDGAYRRYSYTKELVLDTILQAFYKTTISDIGGATPYVAGVVTTPTLSVSDVAYNVVVNNIQVQANAVDVKITLPNPSRGAASTKYLTVVPQDINQAKVVWSQYNNTNFLDWESYNGIGTSYLSYLDTGYELYGDSMRQKSAPYIMTHFVRTETGFVDDGAGNLDAENQSGCLLQARWDWSDNAISGRWSTSNQVYRLKRRYIPTSFSDTFNYGFSVITTKNKIRGKGVSLGLHFESDGNKDMHMLGWSVKVLGETAV